MMTAIILLIAALGAVLIGLVAARMVAAQSWNRDLVAYAVTFPRGLSPEQLTAFLTGAAGMITGRWRRTLTARALAWEVTATSEGIMHHLVVPENCAEVVLAALRAAVPGARSSRHDDWMVPRPTSRVVARAGGVTAGARRWPGGRGECGTVGDRCNRWGTASGLICSGSWHRPRRAEPCPRKPPGSRAIGRWPPPSWRSCSAARAGTKR